MANRNQSAILYFGTDEIRHYSRGLSENLLTNRKNMSKIKLYFGFDKAEVVYVFDQKAHRACFGTAHKECEGKTDR